MVKGLYSAWTGMVNAQNRLDVLTNNLANADTTGYKKEGATTQSFDDRLAIKIKDTSWANNTPQRLGTVHLGVKIGETYTNYDQGSIQVTDNASDLALAGDGFFAISFTDDQGNTSIKYTRDGEFNVDANGYFRDSDGNYLLNANGALNSINTPANYIQVDPTADYSIDEQGLVHQNNQVVGQIGVVDLANRDYFSKYGENLYDVLDGGQIIAGTASVEQGCLEASNVNVVDEMVQMITIQRAYEAAQKVIQTEDSELGQATGTVGRV